MPAGAAIPARAGAAATARSPGPRGGAGAGTDSMTVTLGVANRQFAFDMLSAAHLARQGLVGFAKGTQYLVFFLTVGANVFVDGHNGFPRGARQCLAPTKLFI